MLRLIAVLLVVVGASALGFGSWQMMTGAPSSEAPLSNSESAERYSAIIEPAPAASSAPAVNPVPAAVEPVIEAIPEGSTPAGSSKPAPRGFTASKVEPLPGVSAKSAPPVGSSLDSEAISPFQVATADQAFADSLKAVPIAHETPKQAQFGRAFEVYVALDGTGDDSAADALPGEGNVVEATARVSRSVQATLSGQNFQIEALTPLIQRVSPVTENIWRWKVTPQEVGPQDLVIELFALTEGEAMPVRTFRDKVEVRVSRIGQVVAVAQSVSPIAMVAGGIGSLLAGLLGVIRLFRV